MPSNWLYVDTNFPTFTGEESTEAKVSTIQNYLFMLVEQLRYSLHNLDSGNMNPSALDRYASGLTEPIYRQLGDDAGNITHLQIDAKGLEISTTCPLPRGSWPARSETPTGISPPSSRRRRKFRPRSPTTPGISPA